MLWYSFPKPYCVILNIGVGQNGQGKGPSQGMWTDLHDLF